MKPGFSVAFFALLFTCLLISSCAPSPEPVGEELVIEVEPDEVVQQGETIAQEKPEPVVEVTEETEPAKEPEVTEESFAVSEEFYIETFEDIRQLIDDLNAIVRDENYDKWLKYLTDEYIGHFSSPEILMENSEQPLLKKYNITLSTMRDYFRSVVVPSRSNARLDDLVFIDNAHVKAIMVFNGQRTILYLLKKDVEGWKIGL
jgi:hypothetical protein